jgi:Zn-dependent protease with chaperone function
MGLLLLPVLLVLAVDDALRIAVPQLADDQRAWIVGMPLVALMAVGFPLVLRRVWRTEPLPPGALRSLLERRARQWRIVTRDILVWHTGGRIVNAAVTGFLPPLRYVLLTDALLARFDLGEVEAIFAHEAAHMRRRHLPVRLCALALPVILVFVLLRLFPAAAESFQLRLADWQMPRSWRQAAVLPALLGLYAIGPFARLARLLELEADLLACESLAQPVEGAASSGENDLREPAGRMIEVLEKMAALAGIPRDRTTWLHPSMARRVEHLQTAANDAAYANRFRRRMHALGSVLWLGCGLGLVLLLALA